MYFSTKDNTLDYAQRMCKGCRYYGSTSTCDYYLVTKKRRGCPVGECDKYEAGKKKVYSQKPLKPVPRDEWQDYINGKRKKGLI